jgi:cytochrome c-type biogenesis protein CcmH
MTGFAVCALVLLGLTLLLLGWPLWSARRRGAAPTDASQIVTAYRDQLSDLRTDLSVGTLDAERFEQSRRELDHRLLQEIDAAAAPVAAAATSAGSPDKRGGWIVIALFVLALPIGLYWRFGAVGAFDPALAARGPTVTPQQVEAMVGRLQAHLKEVPSDGEGWMMLGRSYNVLGRYAEAADAYGHAAPLIPDDAQFFADYADALAMANGRSLDGEPMKLVQRALQIDPANPKALALAGRDPALATRTGGLGPAGPGVRRCAGEQHRRGARARWPGDGRARVAASVRTRRDTQSRARKCHRGRWRCQRPRPRHAGARARRKGGAG